MRHFEPLEGRSLFASFTAASVSQLIAAITAANKTTAADTITLPAGVNFTLSTVNNNTNSGANGLPIIVNPLAIVGSGNVIARGSATATPAFRFLDVAATASLTLKNVTLQGGIAPGPTGALQIRMAQGGAIKTLGALTMDRVTLRNNVAQGSSFYSWAGHYPAFGGAVYSAGSLNMTRCVVVGNAAMGTPGQKGRSYGWSTPGNGTAQGAIGGRAYGGGIYIQAGTAVITGSTIESNTARAGNGGAGQKFDGNVGFGGSGGSAYGGGLYSVPGLLTLRDSVIRSNRAVGGAVGEGRKPTATIIPKPGYGIGGGIATGNEASPSGPFRLNSYTLSNIKLNDATTAGDNIWGKYILI